MLVEKDISSTTPLVLGKGWIIVLKSMADCQHLCLATDRYAVAETASLLSCVPLEKDPLIVSFERVGVGGASRSLAARPSNSLKMESWLWKSLLTRFRQ